MEIDQTLDVKTDTLFDRIVVYVATAFFIMTVVLVSIQVLLRWVPYQLGIGHWTEPLSRYVLIIGTYFGAAVAARNHEHISMYFVIERIERRYPRFYAALRVIVDIVVVGFLSLTTYAALFAASNNWNAAFGGVDIITLGQMFVVIAIAIGIYLLYSFIDLRNVLLKLKQMLSDREVTE